MNASRSACWVTAALLFGFLMAGLLLAGCKGTTNKQKEQNNQVNEPGIEQPRITAEYFPIEPGLYKRFDDSEGGWEEIVQKSQSFKGVEVTPVIVKRLDAVVEEHAEEIELTNYTNFYKVTGQAVELVGMESEISEGEVYSDAVDPPWVMLMLGMQQDSEWIYEMLNPPGTVKVTVVGFEDIRVKAGTFDRSVKLRLDSEYITESGETEQTTHYEWYAPGMGLVRVEGATSAKDAELVETKIVTVK